MYDVLVAGAGPAGSLAAIVLARAGVRVLLLDRQIFPRDKLCGDTVNPGGLALLRAHGLAGGIDTHGLPLDGMTVTGASGVQITGTYGEGMVGRAWARRHLDATLLDAACSAGAQFEVGVVQGACLDHGRRRVVGVRMSTDRLRSCDIRARWTIAADGRRSRLAFALGLVRHPRRPRRWAIGTYAEGVAGLGPFGEMHIRGSHYIGVAPAQDDLANLCLVTADQRGLRDPAALLWHTIQADPQLRVRCASARRVAPVVTLGPLAVDAHAAGMPGLLLAGDAAGFVDPMTGDGIHLALRGGQLAAEAVLEDLRAPGIDVVARLAARRRDSFGHKLRFNRALRTLVGWPMGVRLGAVGATLLPSVLQRVIATAGDV